MIGKDKSFKLASLEANKCLQCKKPSCKEGCPVHNEIPLIIKSFKESNYNESLRLLNLNSNMMDICSTVCDTERQCMGHCILNKKNNPVHFNLIENYLSIFESNNEVTKVTPNGKKVAIIGTGPSGIACGLKLLASGFSITYFEKEAFFGGVLTWGIPSFRLDKKLVNNYYQNLLNLGANFNFNIQVDHNKLKELLNDFDDVYLSIGTSKYYQMNIEGENLNNIYLADEFLKDYNLKLNKHDYGKRIIIVGGGNVAVDAARCAKRLGDDVSVTILYRRSEVEMPANNKEILDAKMEGINIRTLINPVKFIGEEKVKQVECAKMILGEADNSGRARPIESNKAHEFIDCDSVILSLGSGIDEEFVKSVNNLNLSKYNNINVTDDGETSIPHLYAGGDCVTGASTVVTAMRDGIKIANSIINKK